GRGGVDDLCSAEPEGLSVARALVGPLACDSHIDAVIAENEGEKVDVGKPRDVVQRQRLAGEKTCNHQGQRSVRGTADRKRCLQALAGNNADTVHGDVTPSRAPNPLRSLSDDPRLRSRPEGRLDRAIYSLGLNSVSPHRDPSLGDLLPAPLLGPCASIGWRGALARAGHGGRGFSFPFCCFFPPGCPSF